MLSGNQQAKLKCTTIRSLVLGIGLLTQLSRPEPAFEGEGNSPMMFKCPKAFSPQLLSSPTETDLAKNKYLKISVYESASAVKNIFIVGGTGFLEKVVFGTIELLIHASVEKSFLEREHGGITEEGLGL